MEKIVTRHFGQENSHRLENYLKDNGYEAARKAIDPNDAGPGH